MCRELSPIRRSVNFFSLFNKRGLVDNETFYQQIMQKQQTDSAVLIALQKSRRRRNSEQAKAVTIARMLPTTSVNLHKQINHTAGCCTTDRLLLSNPVFLRFTVHSHETIERRFFHKANLRICETLRRVSWTWLRTELFSGAIKFKSPVESRDVSKHLNQKRGRFIARSTVHDLWQSKFIRRINERNVEHEGKYRFATTPRWFNSLSSMHRRVYIEIIFTWL